MSGTSQDLQVLWVTIPGALTTSSVSLNYPVPFAAEVVDVQGHLGTAATGADFHATVKANGSVVATHVLTAGQQNGTEQTVQPGAAAGTNYIFTPYPASTPVASFNKGDLLQVGVSQVGSTVAGSDLTLAITLNRK